MLRRIARFMLGIVMGLGIGMLLLGVLAYLLRDQVWQWAQRELSSQLSARITLKSFSVDGWSGFPALTLTLNDLVLTTFAGETLFTSQQIAVYLNFYELLFQRRYRIMGLRAEAPYLRLRWDKAGQSIWSTVFRPSEDTAATSWHIEKLILHHGRLLYLDEKSRISFILDPLHLKASISYTPLLDTIWHLKAEIRTTLRHFATPTTPRLAALPLYLKTQGAFLKKAQQVVLKNLIGSLSALKTELEGHLQWRQKPLYVSLRVRRLYIDFAQLGRLWPRLPKEWLNWPGHISASGTLQGFLGQGHLPIIDLKATLHQKQPFEINGYPLHGLYAKLRLYWHPLSVKESSLVIDSLFLRGQEDSLAGRGTYTLSTGTGSGEVQGYLNLSSLRVVGLTALEGKVRGQAFLRNEPTGWLLRFSGEAEGLRYDTLGLASYRGQLNLGQSEGIWHIQAQGRLRGLAYAGFTLHQADLRWGTETIALSQVRGEYETLQVEAPLLTLRPALEPWKERRLFLSGHLHFPRLSFPPPIPASQGPDTSPAPVVMVDFHIAADTLLWRHHRYGPLRAALQKTPDTLTLTLYHLGGFAQGSLKGTLQSFSQNEKTIWRLELTASDLHIPTLRRDLPELDSLLPLLPHLRGAVSTEVKAIVPFVRERPLWAEAIGEAHIHLKNFIIEESPYTYKLFSIVPLTDFKRIQVGQVQTRLALHDGVVQIDTTLLQANEWRLWVSGFHTLRNDLAYHLLVEVPRNLLLKQTSQVSDIVEEEEGERLRLLIHVTGSPENPTFRWQPASKKAQKQKRPRSSEVSGEGSLPLQVESPSGAPSKKSRSSKSKPALPVEESPR